MKRIYMVWLNYYNKDEIYEEWAIEGDFETALEAAHELLVAQEELKDIDFWNDDLDKPFAWVNRCCWSKFNNVPEYYYVAD